MGHFQLWTADTELTKQTAEYMLTLHNPSKKKEAFLQFDYILTSRVQYEIHFKQFFTNTS